MTGPVGAKALESKVTVPKAALKADDKPAPTKAKDSSQAAAAVVQLADAPGTPAKAKKSAAKDPVDNADAGAKALKTATAASGPSAPAPKPVKAKDSPKDSEAFEAPKLEASPFRGHGRWFDDGAGGPEAEVSAEETLERIHESLIEGLTPGRADDKLPGGAHRSDDKIPGLDRPHENGIPEHVDGDGDGFPDASPIRGHGR